MNELKQMSGKKISAVDLELILKETMPWWEEVRGGRIFITGGTGFFGRWLLESFVHINRSLQLNSHATVLTRDPAKFGRQSPHLAMDPAVSLLAGDICNFDFPARDFEYVIHAATEVGGYRRTEDPLEKLDAILEGTRRILKFAGTHGTKKFLLTSSGSVYGRQPPNLTHISEDYVGAPDTLDPQSVYGEGKRASELMCALFADQSAIECKIARCFAFSGPGLPLDANFAMGNFIRDAIGGGPIVINGDGSPLRSYLYAADLAVWLWTILFGGPSKQAFNVGSEEAISIADLARKVVATLNPGIAINIAGSSEKNNSPLRYVPSTQSAQRVLHLRQTVGLSESIRRMAEWHNFKMP